jgi:hypothetical protein
MNLIHSCYRSAEYQELFRISIMSFVTWNSNGGRLRALLINCCILRCDAVWSCSEVTDVSEERSASIFREMVTSQP